VQRYILGRFLQSIASMLVVSAVVFVLVRSSGDPIRIMAPPEASEADIALMRNDLGPDRPWPVQYWNFLSRALQGISASPCASGGRPWSSKRRKAAAGL
jgi:peptide/nickel transport system permease protein